MNVFDFQATSLDGKPVDLAQYRGKVLLVVNTASKCGFTPQYEGLETLYRELHGRGLEVLGFPCNQFGSQDPGSNDEIASFCQLNYGVSFPMMAKIDVNGSNGSPLYQWLAATHVLPAVSTPVMRDQPKVGRNDPCPCGSGRKYKQCHGKLA